MTAQQLKNSILQMAVQGKLVPQDPNDEPASVLLERIRAEKEQLIKEKKIKKEKNPSVIFRGADNLPYEKVGKNEPVCIVDEIPFDIPDSWEWVRLIEVCEYIQRGKSPKYSTIKKYPVIAQKCNQWDGFSIEKAKFIEPDSLQSYGEERLLQDNDLMWNSTGLGTLGRIAIYKSALNPYELAVADSHVTVIRPFKAFILPEYLYYYFANPSVQNVIEDKADGTTKQKELATATIKAYLVPIPPLDEQKRILEKLEEVLPIVEKYKVVYDTAESLQGTFPDHLKKSILLQAVQGKLVPQDPADEPAEVLLERIREEKQRLIKEGKIKKDKHESIIFRRDNSHYEKLDGVERCIDDEIPFDLPESWTWVRLGYLVKVESGKSLTSKEMKPGKIPVYGGNGITGYHNKYLVDKETVVIGRVGYYCGSVYITEPKAWVTDNAFITTYPTGCIDRDYLVFTLRSMNLGQNNNATAQPVVSGKKIYPKLFPLPPLEEQKRIAIKLKEILPLCKIM